MLYVILQNLQKRSNPHIQFCSLGYGERCGTTFCSVSALVRKDCGGGEGNLDCLGDDIMGFQLLKLMALLNYFLLRWLSYYMY